MGHLGLPLVAMLANLSPTEEARRVIHLTGSNKKPKVWQHLKPFTHRKGEGEAGH